MECNKDDALRAKQIAESKMQSGDFVGALKFAAKAKRLFPDTQNITQVLTVCEVHCAAQNKLPGSQMDWYEILQVDRLADDQTIKKQYKKLALLLHPDKNKCAGAEAAFKLIVEANRMLTDQLKRSKYDRNRGVSVGNAVPKPPSHHANGTSFGTKCDKGASYPNRSCSHSNCSNSHQQDEPDTFWTTCEHCTTWYQYYKTIVNATIRCQQCFKLYRARDVGFQGVPPGYTWTSFKNFKGAPKHVPPKPASESNGGKPVARGQEDIFGQSNPVHMTKCTTGPGGKDGYVAAGGSKPAAGTSKPAAGSSKPAAASSKPAAGTSKPAAGSSKPAVSKAKESEASANVGCKRGRQLASDSRNDNKAGNGNVMKSTNIQEKGVDPSGLTGGVHRRRSSRGKQHATYAETSQNGDFESSPKRRRRDESFNTTKVEKTEVAASDGMFSNNSSSTVGVGCETREVRKNASGPHEEAVLRNKTKIEQSHLQRKDEAKSGLDDRKSKTDTCAPLNSKSSSDTLITCPDPDFSDFEKDKAEDCFGAGQFWALYDEFDCMPRLYALIRKVSSPFKVEITWLEADPDDKGEINWDDAGLPVGCGKFKLNGEQTTSNCGLFSHQMQHIIGSGRGPYLVYPNKGETWAIFKDWDIGWSSNAESHSEPLYECVEVLSDFDKKVGIKVAYLGKVNGFVSLFQRTKQNGIRCFNVPCNELYRFSHRIPSFPMKGNEREGVPIGSFELDPAALASNIFEVSHPGDVKMEDGMLKSGVDCSHHESSKLNDSKDAERVSSIPRRSPRSNRESKDNGKESTSIYMDREDGRDICHRIYVQPGGAAVARQANEKIKTTQKHGKRNYESETLNVRRSPRALSRKNAQVNAGECTTDKVTDNYSNGNRNMKGTNSSQSVGSACASMKNDCKVVGASSFDFKKEKSEGRFQHGQIWAIYSDAVKMPEIYAQIENVEFTPDFRLHVSLLEPCTRRKGRTISCGTFKVKKAKPQILSLSAFSHQLKVEPVGNNRYEIYPRKGEIWALYKGKNHDLTSSNQGRGDCHIVEVLADTDKSIQAVILVPLNNSEPFFKAPRIQRSKSCLVEVLREEANLFSHQIPAFQHNGEDAAHLRGCWVLDPSSIPGFVIQLD